ncbi:unnamed protein product [Symbiodinium natans]|uniref:Uncharacterized protein n=1 Tax=Symbiodinium natans TaxID=878477 RepID=A0A812NWX6_9DINO|nr:unnamed protein product [Symbiodinium natans]
MEPVPAQLLPVVAVGALAFYSVKWLLSGGTDLRSELLQALKSPGQFQQFVQGLVPQGRPPGHVVQAILAEVQGVLGSQAYIELQGSAWKHTNITCSDHDYHIKWFRSAEPVSPVSRQQMVGICWWLNLKGEVQAHMGPTALKIDYQTGTTSGSIDVVPLNGNYFGPGVIVEPADRDFHNNIPRQNAARALKYVAHVLNWRLRSYDLERVVVGLDEPAYNPAFQWDPHAAYQQDRHGLKLFKRAMQLYFHLWPRGWPQELKEALEA